MNALTPELLALIQSPGKTVFAWGAAATLPYVIHQYGIEFSGIIDGQSQADSPLVQGRRYGLNIYSPRILEHYDSDDIIIVVVADIRQFGKAIVSQIMALGDYTHCYLDKPYQQLIPGVSIPDFTFKQSLIRCDTFVANRVCLCIPSLSFGGAERQMVLLAKGFLQLGYDVHLITWMPSTPADWLDELTALGVTCHGVEPMRATVDAVVDFSPEPVAVEVAQLFMAKEFFLLERLCVLLRQIRPSTLISFMDQTNIFAGLAACYVDVPKVVLSVRSAKPDIYHTQPDYLTLADIAKLYQRILSNPKVTLYANASAAAVYYQHWLALESPLPVVDNACELLPTGQDDKVNRLLAEYKDGPLICAAMRLTGVKNPLLFIHIVKGVISELPQAKAILLGDGELRDEVGQLIAELGLAEQVLLMGNVANVHVYFHHADLFIQTSVVEGYPNALVEALLYGCQAIATDVGDTSRVMAQFDLANQVFESENAQQAITLAVSLLTHRSLSAGEDAARLNRIRDAMRPQQVCERILNL